MKKLSDIIKFISKNKKTTIAGIAIILVTFIVLYFNTVSENTRTSPFIKNKEQKGNDAEDFTADGSQSLNVDTEKNIYLVKTVPASGRNNSVNSAEALKFYFSENLNLASLKLTVTPAIKLKTVVYKKEPNVLIIYPEMGNRWENQVSYSILINELESETGKKINETVKFNYQNVITRNINWGESDDYAERIDK